MMDKIYVIDACALINAAQHYNMNKKSFSHIWEAIGDLIEKKRLISSSEILDELKDEELKNWAKAHKECFLPLSQDIQEKTIDVLREYPNLIKIRSTSNSNGDPFLIATAALEEGTIVTDERLGDEKTKDIKIPNVCRAMGIPYMNLHSFLDEILE